MTKSQKNLMDAFAGESQANRKYLAFAKQAEKEGYPRTARLFRAAAEAETIHAHNHLRTAGGIKTTAENLKEALAGETHEFKSMYPEMIKTAEAEGDKNALRTFTYANEVEKIHADLYHKAIYDLSNQEMTDYYVCSVCGYTCENEPPDSCPVCMAKAKAFARVD
ncbi:MAG: rubrerythrin family protein [Deltaproteobacteria bacterium]|nr:rubrerythrin family protein [Deltaproteobacteria bacterium]